MTKSPIKDRIFHKVTSSDQEATPIDLRLHHHLSIFRYKGTLTTEKMLCQVKRQKSSAEKKISEFIFFVLRVFLNQVCLHVETIASRLLN